MFAVRLTYRLQVAPAASVAPQGLLGAVRSANAVGFAPVSVTEEMFRVAVPVLESAMAWL